MRIRNFFVLVPSAARLRSMQVMKELDSLKQIQGPDPNYNDICFSGAGSDVSQLSKVFPLVEMVFGNGQKLSLSPENYLFRHSKVRGAYCLGIFQNGKDPTTLLGGIIVRNTLVTYDREHEKIGFWKTNCSDLWNRLQTPNAPSPVPPGLNDTDSTEDVAPTLAPSEPPEGTRVGLITFYMSLSVNYSDLKPRISELSDIIAKELDVNISQVHLMNFTSKGNESLTKWAIFPEESTGFFSNTTTTKIISRLAENNFHLPDTFGSYKTFDWSTGASPRRTWWNQRYLVLLIAFFVALIIGLSIFGGLLLWKKRQQSSVLSYKPVDSAVPEQELTPL